jgi:hypothetical protein
MVVIFSEPVESSTVTSSSLTLTRDGAAVKGRVQVSTDHLSAEFIPDNALDLQATYSLNVGTEIRDLDGDALAEAYVSTFSTSPSTSSTGALEVTVTTTGPDQDADGYYFSASGPSSHQGVKLAVNGTQTITGTQPGAIKLDFYGLAMNCTAAGALNRTVQVTAGATVAISYSVTCVASGSLRVTSITSGVEPDVDGYSLFDSYQRFDYSHSNTGLNVYLPANAVTTTSAVPPGSYQLQVESVAPNCDAPATQNVTIVAGVETSITLNVVCSPSTQIAFVRGVGEDEWTAANLTRSDIYVTNSNGTGTIRLTEEPGADVNPAWSPDGEKIVFASDRAGNREIYVMNADGTNPVRLTNHAAKDYSPAFSPDGKQIAFVSERAGSADIYVMNADGSNVVPLTGFGGREADPAWSPNGSRIAFSRTDGVYSMNPDGTGVTRLTSAADTQPAWSPDGRMIAFMNNSTRDTFVSVYLMDANGLGIRQFMGGNYLRSSPDWSPDGKHIAFDDRDCWDIGPCPRGITIATIDDRWSAEIRDAAEPAWRPRR